AFLAGQDVVGGEVAGAARRLERVRQGGGGRLVEDIEDFEAGDTAGVLGGLAARVVEVRRHGDDRLAHRADAQLRVLDELTQDDGAQGFGAELAAGNQTPVGGVADAALDEGGDLVRLFQ